MLCERCGLATAVVTLMGTHFDAVSVCNGCVTREEQVWRELAQEMCPLCVEDGGVTRKGRNEVKDAKR
jgi:hypothetical protein